MPKKYNNTELFFRITSHATRGWEVSFSLTEEEAKVLSTVDQDKISARMTGALGGFFKDTMELPADAEKMERRMQAIVDLGPAVHDIETSKAAAPRRKKWTANLSFAYQIILQKSKRAGNGFHLDPLDNGVTDEEAGFEFARLKNRTTLDIGSSWRPSRGTLVKAGFVIDSGRKRKLRSGNEGTVWIVTNPNWSPPELNETFPPFPETEEE